MENITVELCMGTTCFVMGGSGVTEFVDILSEDEKKRVEIKHSPCIGLCKDRKYGKAPYAVVSGEVVAQATAMNVAAKVREYLK